MKLNYKKVGDSGQKIVILHGLFGSLDNWMTHSREFAALGFEVYLVDQRNHGKSPHEKGHNYELMAADLDEFLKDHKIDDCYLVGHSMGGKTVMHYAMFYPNTIKKLVVVDIAPKYYLPHHDIIIKAFYSVDIENLQSRQDAQEQMSNHISDQGVLLFLLKNLDRKGKGYQWKVNLDEVVANIEKVGQTYTFEKPCDLPTLFIRGAKSDYILNEDRDLLKTHFPNSNLVTIRDAGHWVHAEQYENFMKTLQFFFNA